MMSLRLIKGRTPDRDLIYTGPHRQVPLRACYQARLNNPFLNAIYKRSVSYTERWFLEARKQALEENWTHPVMEILLEDADLRRRLIESTVIDGATMRAVLADPNQPELHVSAGVNLGRLQRWSGFFTGLG